MRWTNCAATITCPALANERVQTNAAGQVVPRLRTIWRDGTTDLSMTPLELSQRVAALVQSLSWPAPACSPDTQREWPLRGDHFRAASVAEALSALFGRPETIDWNQSVPVIGCGNSRRGRDVVSRQLLPASNAPLAASPVIASAAVRDICTSTNVATRFSIALT
jgi:hypothetical protein